MDVSATDVDRVSVTGDTATYSGLHVRERGGSKFLALLSHAQTRELADALTARADQMDRLKAALEAEL